MFLLLFIIIFGVLAVVLFHSINRQFKTPNETVKVVKPRKTDITEIYKDISLQPVGCFSSLDEKFFLKQINVYSKTAVLDSGIIIDSDKDISSLIKKVIDNGFDQYGYSMIHKYNDTFKQMSIIELGILGKLAGYNFLSIYKIDETTRGTVYLTYSQPMDKQSDKLESLTKSDLPEYTLTPGINEYTNEQEKAAGKQLSCGYPCLSNGKPLIVDNKQYMCGSVGFPNIKTPTRFAVYRIVEQ